MTSLKVFTYVISTDSFVFTTPSTSATRICMSGRILNQTDFNCQNLDRCFLVPYYAAHCWYQLNQACFVSTTRPKHPSPTHWGWKPTCFATKLDKDLRLGRTSNFRLHTTKVYTRYQFLHRTTPSRDFYPTKSATARNIIFYPTEKTVRRKWQLGPSI